MSKVIPNAGAFKTSLASIRAKIAIQQTASSTAGEPTPIERAAPEPATKPITASRIGILSRYLTKASDPETVTANLFGSCPGEAPPARTKAMRHVLTVTDTALPPGLPDSAPKTLLFFYDFESAPLESRISGHRVVPSSVNPRKDGLALQAHKGAETAAIVRMTRLSEQKSPLTKRLQELDSIYRREDDSEWVRLVEISSSPIHTWPGGGSLAFFITKNDIKARCYDRTICLVLPEEQRQ